MAIHRSLLVVFAFGMLPIAAAPAAYADPTPGQRCSSGADKDPSGRLFCAGQAGIWISNGPKVTVGAPCTPPGDVRMRAGGMEQDHATCRGGVWQ